MTVQVDDSDASDEEEEEDDEEDEEDEDDEAMEDDDEELEEEAVDQNFRLELMKVLNQQNALVGLKIKPNYDLLLFCSINHSVIITGRWCRGKASWCLKLDVHVRSSGNRGGRQQ